MSVRSLRVGNKWVLLSLAAALLVLVGAWRLQPPLRTLHSKLLYLRASRQIERAQLSRALPLLQRSVRANPRLAYAYNDIGHIYAGWGQIEQAQAAYRQAIAADPTFAIAHNNLGWVHLEGGQIEPARRAFEQAVALDPECAAAWGNLGLAERLSGRPEQALLAYQAAVRLDPQDAVARANLGALCYQQGQFREAREHLGAALRLQPDLARARSTLGAIALHEGDLKYARGELVAVAADLDGDPLHHFYLALLDRASGYPAQAEQELERVLTLRPDPGLEAMVRTLQEASDSALQVNN